MTEPVESTPNIGKALGGRLRAIGIDTREKLERLGDEAAFVNLSTRFPEDACTHTRLALAGAVRGVRWHALSGKLRHHLTEGLHD